MPEEFKRLSRDLAYQGAIIDFYKDTVLVPNGNVVKWDFIAHKGAAAVVPVMPDGRLLMVRQYRNALDRYTLEIPAGGRNEADEPFIDCAVRELEEETGYRTDKESMEFLLSIRTTVAFCNEQIKVYVARNLVKTQQNLDEDEYINVRAYEMGELLEKIYSGEMEDAKTVAAILAYQNSVMARIPSQ